WMRSGANGFRVRPGNRNQPKLFLNTKRKPLPGKNLVGSREKVVVFSEKCQTVSVDTAPRHQESPPVWPIIPSLDPLLQAVVVFSEPSFQSHRDILLGWIMCIGQRTEYRVFQTIQASSVVSRVERHPFDRFYNFFSRSAWTVESLAHQVCVAVVLALNPMDWL